MGTMVAGLRRKLDSQVNTENEGVLSLTPMTIAWPVGHRDRVIADEVRTNLP